MNRSNDPYCSVEEEEKSGKKPSWKSEKQKDALMHRGKVERKREAQGIKNDTLNGVVCSIEQCS